MMDTVSAYPHPKEKEDVSIPNEFGEAVTGYENAMIRFSQQDLKTELLVWKLEANV